MADPQRIDFGLKIMHGAFKFESLHLGLFTDEMPRDIEGVRMAQAEYVRELTGMIPEGVKTVLDVGSGLGETSKLLAEKGFDVEGLSPDPYHGEQFGITTGGKLPFHLCKFEEMKAERTYDCLVFGESPQYIDKDAFFPKAVELTAPGSHLVITEFFRIEDTRDYENCFIEADFLARAKDAGFEVTYHRDITEGVIPTLEVAGKFLGYGQRLYEYAIDSAARRAPVKWWLARLFYGRKIASLRTLLFEKVPERINVDKFRNEMHYAMYRLSR